MNYSGYLTDQDGNLYYPRNMQRITTGVEFETGRIIDSKKEYGKRINCGNLPNATTKNVAHGLTNVTYTKPIEGIAIGDGVTLPLPYIGQQASATSSISVDIVTSNIRIYAGNDRSTFTGYVTLYYTKN